MFVSTFVSKLFDNEDWYHLNNRKTSGYYFTLSVSQPSESWPYYRNVDCPNQTSGYGICVPLIYATILFFNILRLMLSDIISLQQNSILLPVSLRSCRFVRILTRLRFMKRHFVSQKYIFMKCLMPQLVLRFKIYKRETDEKLLS